MTTFILTARWVHGKDPVPELSDRSYMIGISDHADFNETLLYVEATGSKEVVTDNQRGGRAVELAIAIEKQLGVKVRASSQTFSRAWGT